MKLLGPALFIERGEAALERAMREAAAAGMKGMDLHQVLRHLVRSIAQMLKRTNTPLLVTAQYR
jgi:hypothetical protein